MKCEKKIILFTGYSLEVPGKGNFQSVRGFKTQIEFKSLLNEYKHSSEWQVVVHSVIFDVPFNF